MGGKTRNPTYPILLSTQPTNTPWRASKRNDGCGRETNGLQAKLVQNDWGTLIPGLYRHLYDVVINGLEITNDRAGAVDFSIPYYYTFEQLAVRAADHEIGGLAGLHGRSAGTLKATLAERILEKTGDINVKVYDDEVAAYSDLLNGRIDAVLLDYPIAVYYAAPNPALKLVGPPIGKLRYGIAMRKGDTELEKQVNQSLQADRLGRAAHHPGAMEAVDADDGGRTQ